MKAVVVSKKFNAMLSRQKGLFNRKKGQDALIRLQFDLSKVTMSVCGQKEMLVLSEDCDTDKPFDVVFKRDNLPKVDTKIADLIIKVENDKLYFNDITISDWNYYPVVESYMKGKYKNFGAVKDFESWEEKLSVDSNELLSAFKATYPTRMQNDALEKMMGFKIDPDKKKILTIDGFRASAYDIECRCNSTEAFTVPEYTYKSLKAAVGKYNHQFVIYTAGEDIIAVTGEDFTYYAYGQYKNDTEVVSLCNKVIGFLNENRDFSGDISYDVLKDLANQYCTDKKSVPKDEQIDLYCAISKCKSDIFISNMTGTKYYGFKYSPRLIENYKDQYLIPADYVIYFNMRYIKEMFDVLDKKDGITLYLPGKNIKQCNIDNGKLAVMILPVRLYDDYKGCIDEIIKGGNELKEVV